MTLSVVFVDPRVVDYQNLLAGIDSSSKIVILDPRSDGISQVTEALHGMTGLASVQFLTHGRAGSVQLAGSDLTNTLATERAADISSWGNALADGGDLLLWGCDVAASDDGKALIQTIATLTGADVAASDDLTGNADLGGDWNLEYATGAFDASTGLSGQADYSETLISGLRLTSIVRQDPSISTTNADAVTFRVTFNAAVTNVDGTDFTFQAISGSVPGATIQLVTPVSGSGGTQFDVLVGNITDGNGTLNLDISPDNNIQTVAGAQSLSILSATGTDDTYTLSNPVQAPTVSSVNSDTGVSSSDAITADQTLSISGTAIANAVVKVYLDGSSATNVIGSTTADGSGNWTFDYTSRSLNTGSHSITATATDTWGSTSAQSSALNLSVDTAAPVFAGGYVSGSSLTLVYNDANGLDGTNLPTTGMFTVTVAGSPRSVTGVSVDSAAKTVTLTLASAVTSGQAVTVAFTDPIGNTAATIQDLAGNDAATFSATSVTNITGQSFTTPAFVVGSTGSIGFSKGGDAVGLLDSQPVVIRDDDDTFLESATITLSGKQTGDVLSAGTLPAGITAGAYDSTTGALTLTGHASLADYQSAIAAIDFSSTSSTYSDRTVSIVVNDGGNASSAATRTVHVLPPAFDTGPSTNALLVANFVTTGTNPSYLDLVAVDLLKNTLTTLSANAYSDTSINAVGFNPLDGHLYAWSSSGAVRINADNTVNDLLPAQASTSGNVPADGAAFKAGDVSPDGIMYFANGTGLSGSIFRLDVNPSSTTYLQWLPKLTSIGGADLAFHPSDSGYLWSAQSGTSIVRVDASTGATVNTYTLSTSVGSGTLWGQYFDSAGYFYVASANGIFRVDLTDPTNPSKTVLQLTVTGGVTLPSGGDGGRLVTVNLDYGDAPNTYKTSLVSDGARHLTNEGKVYLGTGVSSETDAIGLTGVGDTKDDGVSLAPLNISMSNYATSVAVTNNSASTATLVGWIDLDRDGTFDGNEAASTTVAAGFSGNVTLAWSSLPSISAGDSYARFRLSTDAALTTTHSGATIDAQSYGALNDGEVEDYALTIGGTDNTAPTAGFSAISPTIRHSQVGTVNINFSENVTGVDIGDFTLTRNGSPITISGLSVSGSGSSYSVDLSTVTQLAGDYVFTLKNSGTAIQDGAGNVSGGTTSSFTVDTTAPVIDLAPSDSATRDYAATVLNNNAVSLDSNASAATLTEAHDLTKITLQVGGLLDNSNEKLVFGATAIAATGGTGSGISVGGVTVNVAYSSGIFVITKNGGGNLTTSEAQAVIRDLQYRNDSVLPTGGDRTFSFSATDAALIDATVATTTVTVSVDLTPPAGPVTVTALTTNDTTPVLSGTATAQAGETLTITVNGATYTVVPSGGNWSLDLGSATPTSGTLGALTNGNTYNVTATLTDAAGNTLNDATSGELVIDTQDPAGPVTVTALTTNDTTPVLSGTATAQAGETLTVTVNGATYTVVPSGGNWSLDLGSATPTSGTLGALTNGNTYNVTATLTDAAGNTLNDATSGELVIDTQDPAGPVTVTALTTNDTTPVLSGTATAQAGETLTVTVNGATYTVVPSGGNWSLDLGSATPTSGTLGALTNGNTYNVTATLTDAAGNTLNDATSGELVIDTQAPAGPVTVTALTTNDTTPVLSGTATAQAGETLTITVNGATYTVVPSGGNWSLDLGSATPTSGTLGALTNGNTYNVTATLTDAASNTLNDATSGELVIDTQDPAGPVTVTALTTNDTTPVLSGTATAQAGETLTVTVNGATYTVVPSGGSWTLDLGSATPTSGTLGALTNGNTYNVTATLTDAAGNTLNDATSGELVIDTQDPAGPVTVTALTTNDTTPVLSGTATAQAGETLTVTVNGATYTVVPSGGNWSLDLGSATPTSGTLGALTNGNTYNVTATLTDAAGNTLNDATSGELVIDTQAPAGPVTVTALTTNDTTPVLSGTATAQAGETLTITVNGATYTVVPSGGNWSLDLGSATPTSGTLGALTNGNTYNVTATLTDAASNTLNDATSGELVIDTQDPAGPVTVTALTTNDTTPVLSGTATAQAGETLTVTVNGATYTVVPSGGSWTLDLGSATPTSGTLGALTNGNTYNVTATLTDAAGNTLNDATSGELVIDTQDPAGPVTVTALTTNDTTPVLSGTATAQAGETLTVTVNGATYTVVPSGGNWTLDLGSATPTSGTLGALTNGNTYNVTATLTDAAGNTLNDATSGELVIDTQAPVAPVVTNVTETASDPNPSDLISDDNTQVLTVTGETGATAKVYTSGGTLIPTNLYTASETSGTYTIGFGSNVLSDGSYVVTLTDAAGHESSASNTFTIDTTAPAGPVTVTALTTNETAPILSGTATMQEGETLTVTVNGATYTVVPSGGNWTLDLESATPASGTLGALVDGQTYNVTATITDAAGNTLNDATSGELVIDTTAPNGALSIDSINDDTGISATDFLTKDTVLIVRGSNDALSVGERIEISSDGGIVWNDVSQDTGTSWSFSDPDDHTADVEYRVRIVDAAGNEGTTDTQIVTIDTSVSAVPVITDVNDSVNPTTGTVTEGAVTNDANPTLSGTSEPGSRISIYDGATLIGTVDDDGQGHWSFTPETRLPDGPHSFTVIATDAAGNVSDPSAAYTLIVDTTPPADPVVTVSDITADNTVNAGEAAGNVTVTGTVTGAQNGDAVSLSVNGHTYTGTVSGGAFSLGVAGSDLTADSDSTLTVSVTTQDAAGNSATGSADKLYALDTTPPVAPVVTVSVITADNTVNAGEAAGNVNVTGTVTGAQNGDAVTLSVNGHTYNGTVSGGAFSLSIAGSDLAADSDSTLTVSGTTQDAAGNSATGSADKPYAVDTTAPGQTAAIVSMTKDTDVTNDFVTEDGSANRTVSGTLSATLNEGETLQVSFDGGGTWATATMSGGTSWTAEDGSAHGGSWIIQARVVDAAGNIGQTHQQAATLVGAPTQTVTITNVADDVAPKTGPVAHGGTTNDTTPLISGTLSAVLDDNQELAIYRDGEKLGNATVIGTAWTYADTIVDGDETYAYTARVENTANSTHGGSSPEYVITLDTEASGSPAPNLPDADDDGSSNTDNITGKTTISLQGEADPGDTVQIFRPDGSLLATVTADEDGVWSLPDVNLRTMDGDDLDGILGEDGPYTFTAIATDQAGNQGPAGQLTVFLDTRPPVLDLPSAFDTGASDIDNLTNLAVITLQGQAPVGSNVRILRPDGSVLTVVHADADGQWTLPNVNLREMDGDDHDGILGEDGPYTFRAEILQAEGDPVPAGQLTVMLDTTPPATPSALRLDPASDTNTGSGAGADPLNDNITADATPTLDVILPKEPGVDVQAGYIARITYTKGGQTFDFGTATLTAADVAAGKVAIASTAELTDGDYPLEARLYDQAGNFRELAALKITVVTDLDGIAPSVESLVRGGDFNSDGTPDYLQSNVATFPMTGPATFAQGADAPAASFGAIVAGTLASGTDGKGTVVADPNVQLADIAVLSPESLWAKIGVDLSSDLAGVAVDPIMSGIFDFTIKAKDASTPLADLDASRLGLQTRVVFEFPAGITADTYYKIGPTADNSTPHIYSFMADGNPATLDDGAELFDLDGDGTMDRMIVTFTDGANGDDDLTANGVIHDPGFLGMADQCDCDDDGVAVPGVGLRGTRRSDTLDGSDGDDVIRGRGRADTLNGHDGTDQLFGGRGRDVLDGGDGRDTLKGGGGRDTLHGGDCEDTLLGGRGRDVLAGDNGKDVLRGGAGKDQLLGGDCSDRLDGGRGADVLQGEAGDDTLLGRNGFDRMSGGIGDDRLDGGKGRDTLEGDAGNDTLLGSNGRDRLLGGLGNDDLQGGKGRDVLTGGAGNDVMTGGSGKDTYSYLATALGQDDLTAGTSDTINETGGRNLLDFSAAVEQFLKVNGQTLASLGGNLGIQGSIGAETNIAFDRASHTLQIDLDGSGSFDAPVDAQIKLVGINDLVYQAATDQFLMT